MIVVVADDFTGAAELAGISLSFGLTVDLVLHTVTQSNADVLVVCTDSRSQKKQDAISITRKILEDIALLKPSLVYKKIDSVLRGYVLDELKVQMQVLQLNKAVIAPANPSLGRIISEGKYFVDGKEIAKTAFANDPEFPVQSSFIKEILHNEVVVLKPVDSFPENTIAVAEVAHEKDLKNWAEKVDNSFALIGAGDFYTSLLLKNLKRTEHKESELSKPFLFVAGSAFSVAKQRIADAKNKAKAIQIINNYFELMEIEKNIWVLSVKEQSINISALELRTVMALEVKQLLQNLKINELFIEGGSTAAAIFNCLNIFQFIPTSELARGIVRMKAAEIFVSVKPGSYPLPPVIAQIINPNPPTS